jgi:hypothetical protein
LPCRTARRKSSPFGPYIPIVSIASCTPRGWRLRARKSSAGKQHCLTCSPVSSRDPSPRRMPPCRQSFALSSLLIDEADTFLKDNDELRGILNTGHRKGGSVLRTVGDDHEPRQFSTWGPAAIAMIGRLPDTLDDRSVRCSLRRRKASERVESFRSDRAEHLQLLARKMARWAADQEVQLRPADPATEGL